MCSIQHPTCYTGNYVAMLVAPIFPGSQRWAQHVAGGCFYCMKHAPQRRIKIFRLFIYTKNSILDAFAWGSRKQT